MDFDQIVAKYSGGRYQDHLGLLLTNFCGFLRQQKLNYLAFIGRLMHLEYILTLIVEKFSCLFHDFNQFNEKGYVEYSVSANRSTF